MIRKSSAFKRNAVSQERQAEAGNDVILKAAMIGGATLVGSPALGVAAARNSDAIVNAVRSLIGKK
jgi:hypothetical protein